MSAMNGLQGVRDSRRSRRSGPNGVDRRAYGFLLLAVLLLFWEVSSRAGWIVSAYWPPVSHIFAAAIAQLAGIGLYGGTMLEGAVGTAASAHVFSTFGELQFGTELFGPLLLTQELLTEPLQYRDFMLQVPTGPGLGIDIDQDKLAHLRRQ